MSVFRTQVTRIISGHFVVQDQDDEGFSSLSEFGEGILGIDLNRFRSLQVRNPMFHRE